MSANDDNAGPDSFRSFLLENRKAIAKWPEWKRSPANLGFRRVTVAPPEVPASSRRRPDVSTEK